MHLVVLMGVCNILQYYQTLLAGQVFWHIFKQVSQSTVFKVKNNSTKLLLRKVLLNTVFQKADLVMLQTVCNILQYGEILLARQIFWHIFYKF